MNLNYFSTFTGIGAFEQAVKNTSLGWQCAGYSEIDPYAIKMFEKNHPGHKNYGDIKNMISWKTDYLSFENKIPDIIPDFDLLVGGFPCQDLSIAKKNREGLKGDRSGLFYQMIRMIEVKKPKYVLIENVASMKKEDRDIITQELSKAMGQRIEPVMINAALVTAQQRKRLFWCNWKVDQPEDRGIYLRDIVGDIFNIEKPVDKPIRIGEIGNRNNSGRVSQGHGIYGLHGKSLSLTNTPHRIGYFDKENKSIVHRRLTPIEYEKLQGFPDGYTEGVSNTRRYMGLSNAFCVPVIEHIIKSLIKTL